MMKSVAENGMIARWWSPGGEVISDLEQRASASGGERNSESNLLALIGCAQQ
jgi:hypothetical protein